MTELPHSPAAERNKQPILDVLAELLPASGSALEVASGTGQHAVFFAAGLPGWRWLATEADGAMLAVIAELARQAGVSNMRHPRRLDVLAPHWPADGEAFDEAFDAIYCANLLHISPWPTCEALMHGAARYLRPGGLLVTYGPYLVEDVPTAPSNLTFDHDLRSRNPAWGIRRLGDVTAQAERAGLQLLAQHPMPANNLLLVFGF